MVQRADINSVLSEIRSMRSQMMQSQQAQQEQQIKGTVDRVGETAKTDKQVGFGDMLRNAVDNVNELQQNAGDMRTAFEKGDPNVDITRVMVASQKASVSFDALMQVRNRVVKAYEDVKNMPV